MRQLLPFANSTQNGFQSTQIFSTQRVIYIGNDPVQILRKYLTERFF